MASSALMRRCSSPLIIKLSRKAHTTSSNDSKLTKISSSSLKNSLKINSLATKRSLQSIAHVKEARGRNQNAANDAISVGARNISMDPCLSSLTLGELREAKYQSQKLQEKILRWIWEGESWSIFAENDVQITKVKLLPNFETLKIHWSATGVQFVDKVIQQSLDQDVSLEIEERMTCQEDFQGKRMPRIEFIADMSHIHATELAAGEHLQHPTLKNLDAKTNQRATELQTMKILTGISTLKVVEPITLNGADLEGDCIERTEIYGLDYQAVLNQILRDPFSARF